MIRLPAAKIENAVDPCDERLADVYFDKENSRLIATDGVSMVVIPVESDDEDTGGRIPVWAIRVARTMGGTLWLRCRDKLIIESAKRGTVRGKRPIVGFPSDGVDQVVSQIHTIKVRATISLDANRLLHLAEALLDTTIWGCGVTLHIRGEEEPILVEPHVGPHSSTTRNEDGRFGVIMPIRRE